MQVNILKNYGCQEVYFAIYLFYEINLVINSWTTFKLLDQTTDNQQPQPVFLC